VPQAISFFELAPENWVGMGGRSARDLRHFTERHPFVCHGLSLSLGGIAPLDEALLRRTRSFMAEHGMTRCTPSTCRGAPTTATCKTCCRFRSAKRPSNGRLTASGGRRTSSAYASASKMPPATSPRQAPR